ncbi:ABC transporter permease [Dyadobacter tibetensis]|uniref:ABC transporter permease n=1 Tax=Dyadobacter tibetensis TaxID=1211851 RepID=UPI00046F7834|nr:ABC transporter permease [Dyadobacter tibetensis]
MKIILFLLEKEFKQIFRNKALLPMLLGVPLIQLIILPLAADYEIKNINVAFVDHDRTTYSHRLVEKIKATGYFKMTGYSTTYREADRLIELDRADLVLEIPSQFENTLIREGKGHLFLAVNAINGTKASVGASYLSRIIADFNADIRFQQQQESSKTRRGRIAIQTSNWYNPHMDYKYFMVPGILAFLVTMIGGYMSALNIVKEKEIGTIEQINVSPISKHHFIIGKLIPFWLISMVVFSIGQFIVSRYLYHIIPVGNIFLLYLFLAIYLVAILGFGLLVSTYTDTQQQAMSVAFFFVMIFLLMSGLFTSVDSMPPWARAFAYLNPVTYFIEVMRGVVLKGSTFNDFQGHLVKMVGFALALNTWAWFNYRKTS